MNTINLSKPTAIVHQPQHLAVILDMLANGPFKTVNPIIQDIMSQLQAQAVGEKNGVARSGASPNGSGAAAQGAGGDEIGSREAHPAS